MPAAVLRDLEGREHRVETLWSGGPTLLALGHSGCDTTRYTLPFVERAARAGAAAAVVLQDEPGDARELAQGLSLTLPILLEPAPYALSAALGLTVVPTLFLVAADGRVLRAAEAFRRDALSEMAAAAGGRTPLFTPRDRVPELRPG